MLVLNTRNAHQALPEVMRLLEEHPDVVTRESRNGPVRVFDVPMTICYHKPLERVVFWEDRDANPFFHLFESLWMLAGRNDVAFPAFFSSNIGQFSDDGKTFHGAYGHRWRLHFKVDQLAEIIKALKANKDDRRAVLDMWDAATDLGRQGKDVPCNIIATFQINSKGELNMVVYNRSNDLIWGTLGANCVHFSYLLEYIAAGVGVPVGRYWQTSSNMHAYLKLSPAYEKCKPLADIAQPPSVVGVFDPYAHPEATGIQPFPLVQTPIEQWDSELLMFLCEPTALGFRDPFFRRVAVPMFLAYVAFKEQAAGLARFDNALARLAPMADCDWKVACREWLGRRQEAAVAKVHAAEADRLKAQAAAGE